MSDKTHKAPQMPLDMFAKPAATAPVAPAVSIPVSALVEYTLATGERWRVGKFDVLVAEIVELREEHLPRFHLEIANQRRGWMIVRRLFGIRPVLPPADATADDLRIFSREELQNNLGLTKSALAEELEKVRGIWTRVALELKAIDEKVVAQKTHQEETFSGKLEFKDSDLIKKYGFETLITTGEQAWFAQRIQDSIAMLDHPRVGELVRSSLLNELELRRISSRIAKTSREMAECEGSAELDKLRKNYEALFKMRNDVAENYQEQIKDIDEIFPWVKNIAAAFDMKQIFSDAIMVHAEHYSKPEHQIADGVYSAPEMQVLFRVSQQAKEPQYRLGQVFFFNMSRTYLWDRDWRGQFPALLLKKLDAISVKAAMEVSEQEGEVLTDLMSDDPVKGEYPPVLLVEEKKGEI